MLCTVTEKEGLPLNKDRELVPYRWPSVQVNQLQQFTFVNGVLSTFPVSLQDTGAAQLHHQRALSTVFTSHKQDCAAKPWAQR